MRTTRLSVVLALAVVALVSATMAAAAGAAPVWKFNGTELAGKETIVGAAASSELSIPGAPTTCAEFLYNVKIENVTKEGKGEVEEVPLFECTGGPTCTVENITPEKLPWPAHLTTISGKDYLVIENVRVGIKYTGTKCALSGSLTVVKGSVGGLVENGEQRATFDKATMAETKTGLKLGSGAVEWEAVFPTEAFESHRLQTLEG